jgi:hypothetical protein
MRKTLLGSVFAVALTLMGCAGSGYYRAGYYPNVPPPAPRYGAVGYAPGPGYVWADGYWDWRERWVWTPGRWVRPPRGHSHWEPGRWSRGDRGRWEFHRGHWR